MLRKDAEKLIGTHVEAWTSANGVYVGTLQSVSGAPWRGKVLITGILEPAQAFEIGRRFPRKGFRPGETIEVGGCNIKPTDAVGMTYLEALVADRTLLKHLIETAPEGSKNVWACHKHLEVREAQIAEATRS